MISNSDKISRKEEINELFEQLGQVLEQRVEALLIGGAVMLELDAITCWAFLKLY